MARYLIFARKRYEDFLELEGEVEASPADAADAALGQIGDGWLEVQLVPDDEVRWIVGPLAKTEKEGVPQGV